MEREIEKITAHLPQEAMPFFLVFSRFEYALKRSSYIKPEANGGVAADWSKFAGFLGDAFFQEVCERKLAETLIKKPPQKQSIQNGELSWKKIPKVVSVEGLFEAIRRVRNNLLHGGKFSEGPLSMKTDRDEALLVEARSVLMRALEHPGCLKLKSVFFDFA